MSAAGYHPRRLTYKFSYSQSDSAKFVAYKRHREHLLRAAAECEAQFNQDVAKARRFAKSVNAPLQVAESLSDVESSCELKRISAGGIFGKTFLSYGRPIQQVSRTVCINGSKCTCSRVGICKCDKAKNDQPKQGQQQGQQQKPAAKPRRKCPLSCKQPVITVSGSNKEVYTPTGKKKPKKSSKKSKKVKSSSSALSQASQPSQPSQPSQASECSALSKSIQTIEPCPVPAPVPSPNAEVIPKLAEQLDCLSKKLESHMTLDCQQNKQLNEIKSQLTQLTCNMKLLNVKCDCQQKTAGGDLNRKPSSTCNFCKNKKLPVLSSLPCEFFKLIGKRRLSDIMMTILLRADNIYHINVRDLCSGEVLGCLLVDDAAMQEASSLGLFQEIITFCVVDKRSSLCQNDSCLCNIKFEFVKDQRLVGGQDSKSTQTGEAARSLTCLWQQLESLAEA